MCTSEETEFTTTSMTADRLSSLIAQETSKSPTLIQVARWIVVVLPPTVTSKKTIQDRMADSRTAPVVTICAARWPT